jgi:hypothetical protein
MRRYSFQIGLQETPAKSSTGNSNQHEVLKSNPFFRGLKGEGIINLKMSQIPKRKGSGIKIKKKRYPPFVGSLLELIFTETIIE